MTPRESYRLKCIEYMLIGLVKGSTPDYEEKLIQIYTEAAKDHQGEDDMPETAEEEK